MGQSAHACEVACSMQGSKRAVWTGVDNFNPGTAYTGSIAMYHSCS